MGYWAHELLVWCAPAVATPMFGRWMMAASAAVSNQGYLPLSIVPSVLSLKPFGEDRDTEADITLAVSVISIYLMVVNLSSWTLIHWFMRLDKQRYLASTPGASPAVALQSEPTQAASDESASTWQRFASGLRSAITPPIAGCLAGIALGLIPPVKALLHSEEGEDLAPLEPTVTAAIKSLGTTVVPIVLLQLGATMHDMVFERRSSREDEPERGKGAEEDVETLQRKTPDLLCKDSAPGDSPCGASAHQAGAGPTPDTAAQGEATESAEGGDIESATGSSPRSQSAASVHHPDLHVDVPCAASGSGSVSGSIEDASGVVEATPHSPPGLSSRISTPVHLTSLAVKLLLMPAVGFGFVAGLLEAGVLGPGSTSPVLPFLFIIEFACPSALNIIILADMERYAQREASTVVFLSTVAGAVGMTVWITGALTLVQSYYPE